MVTEAMLCIKNGKELFERTQAVNIIVWLLIQLGVSIIFVYGCMVWQKYFMVKFCGSHGSERKNGIKIFFLLFLERARVKGKLPTEKLLQQIRSK